MSEETLHFYSRVDPAVWAPPSMIKKARSDNKTERGKDTLLAYLLFEGLGRRGIGKSLIYPELRVQSGEEPLDGHLVDAKACPHFTGTEKWIVQQNVLVRCRDLEGDPKRFPRIFYAGGKRRFVEDNELDSDQSAA